MISIDTEVTGFDARSWCRLVGLVAPGLVGRAPGSARRAAAEPGGVLWVTYGEQGVIRAMHSRRGAVVLEGWSGPQDLERCAAKHGARYAFAAREGDLEELYERVGMRLRGEDDFFCTLLVATVALRELMAEGRVHTTPRIPAAVPTPTLEVLRSTFDALLPEGRQCLVATFEDAALDTAMIVERRGAVISRVMGPEALRAMVGPLGGDFRRDFRIIRLAVERSLGPLSLGLYAETETLRTLLRTPGSGQWARAIAAREVMIDPMPAWIAMAAGAGALRAAVGRSHALLEALGLAGVFGPLAGTVRLAGTVLRDVDLKAMLGFDPLDTLAALIRRSASAPRADDASRTP